MRKIFLLPLLLAACAETPTYPTVAAMPGPGKSYGTFRDNDARCAADASQRVQGMADHANNRGVLIAGVSTVLGTALGAAIGGGRGAGIGAASGLGIGSAVGLNSVNGDDAQSRFNIIYLQCMHAYGNYVPGVAMRVQ